MIDHLTQLGAVIIGRNEGDHLRSCLKSVARHVENIVYVDSGSTDSSVTEAQRAGCMVVELDMTFPFSAARARNAGFEKLISHHPQVSLVQFVDGDCEVQDGWLPHAASILDQQDEVAIICGRRRERNPEASIYNRLCDIEWDTPIGDAQACGGDFMAKVAAIAKIGGFNPTAVAGEEPELCYRLRQDDWRIQRIDREMTTHDAGMIRFSQWWHRTKRAGYAFALVSSMHWRGSEKIWAMKLTSILAWALVLPVALLSLSIWASPWFLLGLSLYPLHTLNTYRKMRRVPGLPKSMAAPYATACTVGRFAELLGVIRCWRDLMFKRPRTIIEYKLR